jgi:heavy metal efflux system protein
LLIGCGWEEKPAAICGRGQSSFVAEAQAQFAAFMKLPDGYQVAWGGQFENLERAQK